MTSIKAGVRKTVAEKYKFSPLPPPKQLLFAAETVKIIGIKFGLRARAREEGNFLYGSI